MQLLSRSWLLLVILLPTAFCAASPNHSSAPLPVPVVFEPNLGQAGPGVRYLARTSRFVLHARPSLVEFKANGSATSTGMRFVGGNPRARIETLDVLSGKSFYYRGDDPARWIRGVPQYARLRYRELYPGIDAVLYGNEGELEYDLVVSPGADPGRVRLRFEGAREVVEETNGSLRIESAAGAFFLRKPVVYQEGDGARREIAGSYVVRGHEVRLVVGGYDRRRPLVIDPVVSWATYLGGSADEAPCCVAIDTAGNTYLAGTTSSADYPAVPKISGNVARGGLDVFITKLDPTGKNVLYSVFLGGTGDDEGFGLAVDPSGNAYLTGDTFSTDFPVMTAYQPAKRGAWDAFVTKLDPSGNLVYSTYLGGGAKQPSASSADDTGFAITADASGNAYVTGITYSSDFPFTLGTLIRTPDWGEAFVVKLGPPGNLVFSTLIGGNDWDAGWAITLDNSGTLWVAGDSLSANLPTTAGVVQRSFAGGSQSGDAWVAKINPLGSSQNFLVALTYLGGSRDDDVWAIKADGSGNVYLAGSTLSTDFPVTAGALQTTFGGGASLGDAWIAKLNSTLTAKAFVTYFGGSGDEDAEGLALDASGNICIVGGTTSTSLTPASLGANPGALQTGLRGDSDAYLLQVNPAGSSAAYFTYLGGTGTDYGVGLAAGGSGDLTLLAYTESAGMPVQQPALQSALAGASDAFLLRVNLTGASPVTISSIAAAYGGPDIGPNTWIEIKGAGLAPSGVGPEGFIWSTAPEFASGRMPTQLRGVSVTVNGKPAYIYWISPTQVNALTPLDAAPGPVQVRLTNGANTSAPFTVNMRPEAPTLLMFNADKYVTATHANYGLLGPASMSVPGYPFTPAQPNETVLLYATGFGLPSVTLVEGSSSQSGPLPVLPVVQIGGASARVEWAGVIMPGLYQLNVNVPSSASTGDNEVLITHGGFTTQAGARIAVQR